MVAQPNRQQRLAALLVEYEQQLVAATEPDEAELLAQHADLLPELAKELKKRRLVFRARRAAQQNRPPSTAADDTVSRLRTPESRGDDSGEAESFGDYEILELLGRGGMGVVYKARQRSLGRLVALKMLRLAEFASDEELQRFRAEAAAAAQLAHPGIVAVYEIGVLRAGSPREAPFFSMAYVRGQSLHQRLREAPLAPREAAQYLAQAARAIAYAHERGVLHRDLKPHNILIDEHNEPRITDFGLAKRFGVGSELTVSGQILGTPSYMPPEQALANQALLGPQSDVYSLGATLYACLTGRAPFVGDKPTEVLLQVIHQEPLSPRALNPAAPRDLEVICLKCLSKEPSRRYATATALADDLQRFLRHEPIAARPASRGEQLIRWCRRAPWQAAAATLALAAVLLTIGLGVVGIISAQVQSRLRGEAEQGRSQAERNLVLAEARLTQFQHKLAELHLQAGAHDKASESLTYVPPRTQSWDTWRLRHEASFGPQLEFNLASGYWSMLAADLDEPAARLATADASGLVVLWDLKTGRRERELTQSRFFRSSAEHPLRQAHHFEDRSDAADWLAGPACFTAVAWRPGKRELLGASLNGSVVRWSGDDWRSAELCRLSEPLFALAVSADGKQFLLGGGRGGLSLRAADGAALTSTSDKSPVLALVQLAGGQWLVGREDGRIQWLDAKLALRSQVQIPAPLWALAAGPQGVVAAAGAGDTVQRFASEAKSGQLTPLGPALPLGETGLPSAAAIHALRFSRSGEQLFAGDDQGRVTCWNTATGSVAWRLRAVQKMHPGLARLRERTPAVAWPPPFLRMFAAVLVSSQPHELVTVAGDAAARLHQVGARGASDVLICTESAGPSPRLAFDLRQPQWLWALASDGQLRVFNSRTGRLLAARRAHGRGLDLAVTATGVATAGGEPGLGRWRYEPSQQAIVADGTVPFAHVRPLLSVAVSPADRWLAAVDEQANLIVWDSTTGEQRFLSPLGSSTGHPLSGRVAFNCDGTLLAAYGAGQTAPIFATSPFRKLDEHLNPAGGGGLTLCWSRTDPYLVRGTDDYARHFQMWVGGKSIAAGAAEMAANTPQSVVRAQAITPDGRRWARLEQGGLVTLMSHDHFLPLYQFRNPRGLDADLTFDPSGRRLALAGADGRVEIWESAKQLPQIAISDDTPHWRATPFLSPSAKQLYIPPETLQFDPQNRPVALVCEFDGNKPLPLYFLRLEIDRVVFEQLQLDGSAADRRVLASSGPRLYQQANGEPLVAYRRVTQIENAYDGSLLLAARRGPDDWRFETVVESGNSGHYPVLARGPDGAVNAVFHFSYAVGALQYSERTAEGWRTTTIGPPGSGQPLTGVVDAAGVGRFAYMPKRFEGDRNTVVFAEWRAGKLVEEPISAQLGFNAASLQIDPDGRPLILRSPARGVNEIFERGPEGWRLLTRVPSSGQAGSSFTVGTSGQIELVEVVGDDFHWELRLLTYQNGAWTGRKIYAESKRGLPTYLVIARDAHSRPVAVVGRLGEPYGWADLIQPRE